MAQAKHVTTAIPSQITGITAKTAVSGIRATHTDFVASVAARLPRPIPLFPVPANFEDRAEHLKKVLEAVSVYVIAVLEDTAEDVAGGVDLGTIKAALSDLVSDVGGTVRQAANDLAGRLP